MIKENEYLLYRLPELDKIVAKLKREMNVNPELEKELNLEEFSIRRIFHAHYCCLKQMTYA